MLEWIVSSTILISAILLLRLFFKDRISKRLQYVLWGLVVLRLLIPGSVSQSVASTGNLIAALAEKPVMQAASGSLDPQKNYDMAFQEVLSANNYSREVYSMLPQSRQEALAQEYGLEIQQKLVAYSNAHSITQILRLLWLTGGAILGFCLVYSNFVFRRRLKISRKKLDIAFPLPVYYSAAVSSPCLFGCFRPAIYLPGTIVERKAMPYVLVHELTHYRHWDHIWAVLRLICLTVHWYNPLVWIAAKVSRVDGELACDEGTLAILGEGSRERYGQTLIEMTRAKPSLQDYTLTATTMTSDKRNLYRRVQLIAKKQRFILTAVIAFAVCTLLIVGCTFTGAVKRPDSTTGPAMETVPTEATFLLESTVPVTSAPSASTLPPEPAVPTSPKPYHPDIMAVPMVRMMGMLYVLDNDADSLSQQLPAGYVYLGVCYEDNESIPKWDGGSRHIPNFTELYASLEETDYIYYDTGNGYQRLIRAALVDKEVSKSDPDNWAAENYTSAFFATLLRGDSQNPYHQAAGQVFYQPEGVDLYEQFYNGFREWEHHVVPLSDVEKAFLSTHGWGDEMPMRNAKRFPISAMDDRLQRFFGITFAQSWQKGLDRMPDYMENNQCYYAWRSDTRSFRITILSVEHDAGSSLYHITYVCDQGYLTNYCLTLIKTDQVLQIYSNVPAGI